MKGPRPAAEVDSLYGSHLDKVIYMPKVKFGKPEARLLLDDHLRSFAPPVFELSYADESCVNEAIEARNMLSGKALIWYNTLWDTQCGDHDDDRALTDPDGAYGFLIDTLGARIIQTDRAELLLDYLRSRSLHN